jgi:hypothetical protein
MKANIKKAILNSFEIVFSYVPVEIIDDNGNIRYKQSYDNLFGITFNGSNGEQVILSGEISKLDYDLLKYISNLQNKKGGE